MDSQIPSERTTSPNNLISQSLRRNRKGAWRGTALIVEILVILVVVVACLTVFVKLFSYAYTSNAYDQHRAHAITLATNQAERFAADTSPATGTFTQNEGKYTTTWTITAEPTERGTLYSATISVSYTDQELYTLSTARYVSSAPAATTTNTPGAAETAAETDEPAGEGTSDDFGAMGSKSDNRGNGDSGVIAANSTSAVESSPLTGGE